MGYDVDTALSIQGIEYKLPPRTVISLGIATMGTDPVICGSDSMLWRPNRFVTTDGRPLEQEEFIPP